MISPKQLKAIKNFAGAKLLEKKQHAIGKSYVKFPTWTC